MQNYYDDSNSDTDSEDSEYDVIYEPEECSKTRFNIVLCELFNEAIHGSPLPNSIVAYHFLTMNRYKKLHLEILNDLTEYINIEYQLYYNKNHPIFKNYRNIVTRPNYIKPEIAECLYLTCGRCICIIKTFWLKIIQRKWRKIYNERQNIFKKRCSIQALKYREVNGKWHETLIYPSIRGMLTF
jgi:hypothetical protein